MSPPDYHNATWLPALDMMLALGRRIVQAVILHSTSLDAPGFRDACGTAAPLSAHYHVAEDGHIHQMVRERDIAIHSSNPRRSRWNDEHTIGIVLEHAEHDSPWPDTQLIALARLIQSIRLRYPDVPIHTHADIAKLGSRIDDPPQFPLLELEVAVQRLNDQLDQTPPLPA